MPVSTASRLRHFSFDDQVFVRAAFGFAWKPAVRIKPRESEDLLRVWRAKGVSRNTFPATTLPPGGNVCAAFPMSIFLKIKTHSR
jgi:hypothetical protein